MLTQSWLVIYSFLHLLQTSSIQCAAPPNDSASWQQYVRAPPNKTVLPKTIVSTSGKVTNPTGLLSKGLTILERADNSSPIPTVVIDFGQDVVGLLSIDFAGAKKYGNNQYPGLRLAFSETLEALTDRSDFTRSDNAQGALKIVPSGTDQVAVKPKPYTWLDQWGCESSNKICADGLHGFRYVKLTLDALTGDAPYTSNLGQINITSVKLQWSGYLGTPDTYTGWFECSDRNLTQWWYDASYTNEMCVDTFRSNDTDPRNAMSPTLVGKTVLHDGAKRDRDPYMGDIAVSGLTSYLTHNIPEAARNVMEDLAQHQRSDGWIPPASINNYALPLFDYPLWWVVSSWDYVYYTGNTTYITKYYNTLKSVLNTYYPSHTNTTTSLLVRPPGYGDYAFIPRDGSAAYYSALYVLALNRAADLATLTSNPTDARTWQTRATSVSKGFISTLWDPSVSAFFDRACTGLGCKAHAQDGNSLAILSGIVAPNSTYATSALKYLSSATSHPWGNSFYDQGGAELNGDFPMRVYAFTSYFEIAARFLTGATDSALEETRRLYGWMASRDPYSTFWEAIGNNGGLYEGGFTSMAHGWSTGIVPLITNYVLGVTPTKPGFQTWVVKPQGGDLQWARGVVPTMYGPLGVQWTDNTGNGTYVVHVDAPKGTNGTVVLPSRSSSGKAVRSAVLDGVVVWDSGRPSAASAKMGVTADGLGSLSIPVVGGQAHTVAVQWAS